MEKLVKGSILALFVLLGVVVVAESTFWPLGGVIGDLASRGSADGSASGRIGGSGSFGFGDRGNIGGNVGGSNNAGGSGSGNAGCEAGGSSAINFSGSKISNGHVNGQLGGYISDRGIVTGGDGEYLIPDSSP